MPTSVPPPKVRYAKPTGAAVTPELIEKESSPIGPTFQVGDVVPYDRLMELPLGTIIVTSEQYQLQTHQWWTRHGDGFRYDGNIGNSGKMLYTDGRKPKLSTKPDWTVKALSESVDVDYWLPFFRKQVALSELPKLPTGARIVHRVWRRKDGSLNEDCYFEHCGNDQWIYVNSKDHSRDRTTRMTWPQTKDKASNHKFSQEGWILIHLPPAVPSSSAPIKSLTTVELCNITVKDETYLTAVTDQCACLHPLRSHVASGDYWTCIGDGNNAIVTSSSRGRTLSVDLCDCKGQWDKL